MKKYGILFLVNLVILLAINGYYKSTEEAPQTLSYRFTFICPQTWDEVAAGMEKADEELGTDTKYIGFKNLNEERQAEAIRTAIYSNVNGIITVGNNNSKVIGTAVEEAEDAGIPVILLNSDLENTERSGYIGMNHEEAGRLAGEDMVEILHGKPAHVGIIVSDTDDMGQKQRMNGFLSVINQEKNIIVEETLEENSDRMKIRKSVSKMLKNNKRINAIFCADVTAADMLGDILEEEGYYKDDMKIVCFGMSKQIYNYLQEGIYSYSITDDSTQMGYQAVKALKDCINEGEKEQIIYTQVRNADKNFDFASWKAEWENWEGSWILS